MAIHSSQIDNEGIEPLVWGALKSDEEGIMVYMKYVSKVECEQYMRCECMG